MSPFGACSTKRFGIRQAPARVLVSGSMNLLASIKARSEGPARSTGATPLITCDVAAPLTSAPVSAAMSAIVNPDGRSKKRRFPIYQSMINETGVPILELVLSNSTTGGPILTFVPLPSGHFCECQNQRTASKYRLLVEFWI